MKIFLSYAPQDHEWARKLASSLKRKGFEVWDAAFDISPGKNWHLEIGKALEDAQAMIVLVSPAAAESDELAREIDYALGTERFRNRLIPVIVKPTKKLPWILDRLKPEKGEPSEVSDRITERLKPHQTATA